MFMTWHFFIHTQDLGSSWFNLVNFVITAIESASAKYLFAYVQPTCLQHYFLSCFKIIPAFVMLRFQKGILCPIGALLPEEGTGRALTCLAANRVFFK